MTNIFYSILDISLQPVGPLVKKGYYLKEIKADITVDLCGLNIEKSAEKIKTFIHLPS